MLPIVPNMRALNLSLSSNDNFQGSAVNAQINCRVTKTGFTKKQINKKHPLDSGVPPVRLDLIMCIYVSCALHHAVL